jgi:flagellar protein FlbD
MIELTRLRGKTFVLNCETIETVEETPDTVITTKDGKKYVVLETIDEVVQKVVQYKSRILLINRD